LKKAINALFRKTKQPGPQAKTGQESWRGKYVKATRPVPKTRSELELKTFLADNLDVIEPGLRLFVQGSWTGLEVPCSFSEWSKPGQIDILAVDQDGDFLVIEVKLDGKAAAFGQILCYMAWIAAWARSEDRRGYTKPVREVRGAIVVKRASPMLVYLVSAYPQFPITVYETERTVSVTATAQAARP
jgi:hypothetical protein